MRRLEGLNPDFEDVLRELAAAGCDFLVVGAYALAAHGIPRATGDIDIFVRPDPDNAARVVRALESFGAPLEAAGVTAGDFVQPGTVYQIGLPPRRIDILTSISGVSFDEARAGAVVFALDAFEIPFIGRAALLRNKRATGRPKDELDALELERGQAGDPPPDDG